MFGVSTIERMIRGEYAAIWYCEVDHPIYQDTVEEIVEDIISKYNRAIVHCRECKYRTKKKRCRRNKGAWLAEDGDYCSKGVRRWR